MKKQNYGLNAKQPNQILDEYEMEKALEPYLQLFTIDSHKTYTDQVRHIEQYYEGFESIKYSYVALDSNRYTA